MQIIKYLPPIFLLLIACNSEPVPPPKSTPHNENAIYLSRNYVEFWQDSCKFLRIYKKPNNDFDYRIEHAWDCPMKKHKEFKEQ